MKKILSFISILSIIFTGTVCTTIAESASKLGLTMDSETASVGENVSLKIEALGSDGEIAKTYKGTIFLFVEEDANSSDDLKTQVPYGDSGYTFKAGDNGSKTFSGKDSFVFKREGDFTIIATDLDNESVSGKIKIKVGASGKGSSSKKTASTGSGSNTLSGSTTKVMGDSDLEITAPEEGTKIFEGKTTVAGIARKNSKVKAFINLKNVGEAQTDKDGNFSFDISGLSQANNKLEVKLYDGNDKLITSKIINLQVDISTPIFNGLTVKEGDTAVPGATLNVELMANPGLKEVKIMLGEDTQNLVESESEEGKYVGTITAPSEVGEYQIKASLKDEKGKETVKDNAKTIIVERKESLFKNVQVSAGNAMDPNGDSKKVLFKFQLNGDTKDVVKFKIKYGSGADNLNKEVLTYEKEKIAIKSGSGSTGSGVTIENEEYSRYIPGLDPNGKYFFKIFAINEDGKELSESDIIEYPTLNSAGKCSISNISGLKVTKKGDTVEITWDKLAEASSYNIYKKSEDGSLVLIENIKENRYKVHISGDKVKYEDFAVKGVCGNNESESKDFSLMAKVQTGPKEIIAILLISLIISYFVVIRRRKNAII
ncbi:MAG: hypothetical protein PHF46_04665 [Candidatus Gracilibacteria bacterium]|nr:hypothetical protein [Candidatus Gracilibacteria bacterium]